MINKVKVLYEWEIIESWQTQPHNSKATIGSHVGIWGVKCNWLDQLNQESVLFQNDRVREESRSTKPWGMLQKHAKYCP